MLLFMGPSLGEEFLRWTGLNRRVVGPEKLVLKLLLMCRS